MKMYNIIITMHAGSTRIYEYRGQNVNEKKGENKIYEYYFVCTYDPTGKRLDHKYTHKVTKPITPNPWVFQRYLDPKISTTMSHIIVQKNIRKT